MSEPPCTTSSSRSLPPGEWGNASPRGGALVLNPLPLRVDEAAGVAVVEERQRPGGLRAAVVEELRGRGLGVLPANGWEDYDARVHVSPLAHADLQTSSYPEGYVQVRFRARPKRNVLTASLVLIAAAAVILPPLAGLTILPAAALALGFARARRLPRQLFASADA